MLFVASASRSPKRQWHSLAYSLAYSNSNRLQKFLASLARTGSSSLSTTESRLLSVRKSSQSKSPPTRVNLPHIIAECIITHE